MKRLAFLKNKEIEYVTLLILIIISIISLITFFACAVIVYHYRLIPTLQSISFSENNIIFNENAQLNQILLHQNIIYNLSQLFGHIRLKSGSSYFDFGSNGLEVFSSNGLSVYSSTNGKLLFPFYSNQISFPSISCLSLNGDAKNIYKIRSPTEDDLNIFSDRDILISGNEGVLISSKIIKFDSRSINLTSLHSGVILNSKKGIKLDTKSLLISNIFNKSKNEALQYKLCICTKNGRLFKLKLKNKNNNCADVRFPESFNPCN